MINMAGMKSRIPALYGTVLQTLGKENGFAQQILAIYFWNIIVCKIIDHIVESRNTYYYNRQ